jgi:hypothetical protein
MASFLGVALAACAADPASVSHDGATGGSATSGSGAADATSSGVSSSSGAGGASSGPTSTSSGSGGGVCSPPPPPTPAQLGRGLKWVRDNPTFLTGLVPRLGAPSKAFADAYFDDFHANAVHLWQLGVPTAMNGWRAHRPADRWLSWLRDDGTSGEGGQVLGGYPADEPGRVGWQIGDEPRNMQDLMALEPGVNAVRSADPNALIVLNYSFSADGLEQMLDYAGQNIDYDVVSFDNYSGSSQIYGRMAVFREQALSDGMPYWGYLNAYNGDFWPSESDMRWNVFSHALYGFTGFSWFIYQISAPEAPEYLETALFDQTGTMTATPNERFTTAAQLNVELLNLMRSLSQLTSTDVRYIPFNTLGQPKKTSNWAPGAGGDPYITAIQPDGSLAELNIGFFEDDYGDVYVMVQNPHHENGSFPVDNSSSQNVRIDFDFSTADACVDTSKLRTLDRQTGQVMDLPLVDHGDGSAHLDVLLEAGNPILFKYANEIPFAQASW